MNASYNRTSAAYDFAAAEERTQPKKAKSSIKLHKVSVAKTGSWFKATIFVAFAAFLAFIFISSKSMISEISTQINQQTEQLNEAKEENSLLQAKLDGIVTLSKVDEVAVNELGLQKTVKTQVRYISVNDRTMVQTAEHEENVFESLKNWLNDTAEYLGF